MSKIAFLGLGQMGSPMATRLVEVGHDVTVWNRTTERTAPLEDRGAAVASTPAQAAAGVEVVITVLSTPAALDEVVFGEEGLAAALAPGQVLVDMSTVGPEAIRGVASRLPDGVAVVDAPVRGSVPQATEGTLEIFVGAGDEDFQRARPILEVMGSVRHVGPPGSGAAVKLVVNMALLAAIVTLGEALALGTSLHLDRETLLDVLAGSPIGPTSESKRANLMSGRYPPRFKLELAAKDIGLAVDAAEATGRPLRVAQAAKSWLDEAAERGDADLDYSAVLATILGEDARA